MGANINEATARGAIEYLDSLVTKHRAPASVVSPLKTSVTKVLQRTQGPDWGRTDLLSLDIGDTMMRFKTLTLTEYSDGSYRTYEMRLKKAIEWYLNFLRTPGWAPPAAPRPVSRQSVAGQSVDQFEGSPRAAQPAVEHRPANDLATTYKVFDPVVGYIPQQRPDHSTVIYPFPLASGKTASLHIPRDITADDVRRLQGFLESLVIGETLPEGRNNARDDP